VSTRRRRAIGIAVAAAVAGALAFALAGHGASGASSAKPTYYQHVKPILDGRCAGCHYSGGIAPFALTTYKQARKYRSVIAAAVARRTMPPWHAERGVRAYLYDPSLTAAQIRTIRSWVAARAPAGNPVKPAPALPSVAPQLSRVDLRLRMPAAYTPRHRLGGDDYRCFVLDWKPGETTHVTGVNVVPGRQAQVHHIILFLAPPSSAATVDGWETADSTPGYRCYGGPGPGGSSLHAVQFVAGWVPGSSGSNFPAGTGVKIERGSRLILQVHYNLDHVHTAPRPDRSTVELSLAPLVERRGIYIPLVRPEWVLFPRTFAIPAGRKNVVHTFTGDPREIAGFFAPDLDLSRGFTIHTTLLHMHRLGVSGRVALERAGGLRELLLSVRRWDFNWQREYRFAEAVTFDPGDRLSISCRHDNSRANQPQIHGRRGKPHLVTWGENSSDEMCIAFLYVTER
jgi:hypothetical protein